MIKPTNALAEFVKSQPQGAQPGQRFPNMGKGPFEISPTLKAKPQTASPASASQAGRLSGINGRPQAAPLPEAMTRPRIDPSADRGSTERASPRQGLVQRDGNRVSKGDAPTKAPLPTRSAFTETTPTTGMERSMQDLADKLHPLGKSKSNR